MKTLYILRHAKASRKHTELNDFSRPLTKKGVNEIVETSAFAKAKKIKVDKVLSSPSTRTYSTAVIFCSQLQIDLNDLDLKDSLYDCTAQQIVNVLQKADSKCKSLVLVGHNPSLSDLLHRITNEPYKEIETGALVAVDLDIKSWKDISKTKGKIDFLIVPSRHLNK